MKLKKNLHGLLMAILITIMALTGSQSVSAQAAAPLSITGWFSIVWGDGPAGSSTAEPIYTLTDGNGETTTLLMDDSLAASQSGILALDRQRVTVQGVETLSLSAQGGQEAATVTMQVSSISLESPQEARSANGVNALVSGSQPFVSIMCKFSGNAAEPENQTYFQNMYGNFYPGLDHYWREVSYDAVNIAGSNAYGWYVLPRTHADYGGASNFNLDLAADDCTNAADADINFANYPGGINLMFNSDLNGFAWGGAKYMTLDGVSKLWPVTWEPPWGYADITVIAHEMGHAFGLPHSSGGYGQTYDNEWDVMSDAWSNCSRSSNVTYGCLGQHTISVHKDLLGWIPAGQKFIAGQNTSTTITLEQLALPTNSNYKMAQIPINGSSTHFYTVEVRRQTGYDVKLPGQAVIIHEVDLLRTRPAYVVDADGNGDTGDAGAMWTVGEDFSDTINQITVSVISATSTGFRVHITSGQNIYYISGNIGLAGKTVIYTGGSTTTDSNGYYSIIVPLGWTGTVTPSSSCYTYTPLNRNYTNISSDQVDQNYTPSAPDPACAAIDVSITGERQGSYFLATSESRRQSYAGVDSGPVKVVSTNGVPIIAALRDAWLVNGQVTSFSQLMGLPQEQLSDTYLFPAYNNVTLSEQIRFANVDTVATTVTVTIGGVVRGTYPLNPSASLRVTYPLDSGPVEVKSSGGVKIIAAIRDAWLVNGQVTSFTQIMGLPKESLSDTYLFPAYNNVTLSGQLRFGNVGVAPTVVTVKIAGAVQGTYPLNPSASVRVTYPLDAGPVEVKSSGGVKIIAALRDAWLVNGQVKSFAQLMGLPKEALSDTYLFPAYNNVTLSGQLRFANVDLAATTVTVKIGGVVQGTYPLNPSASVRVTYPLDAGPVEIKSSGNVKIIAALRDAWLVSGVVTSFVQMMGLPNTQLSDTYWFPAYNNVTLSGQLRFGVP